MAVFIPAEVASLAAVILVSIPPVPTELPEPDILAKKKKKEKKKQIFWWKREMEETEKEKNAKNQRSKIKDHRREGVGRRKDESTIQLVKIFNHPNSLSIRI